MKKYWNFLRIFFGKTLLKSRNDLQMKSPMNLRIKTLIEIQEETEERNLYKKSPAKKKTCDKFWKTSRMKIGEGAVE